jgi:glyceraldehyde 3-phosphate dehydrogenase
MSVRIGLNGFGRMGRLFLRAAWGRDDLEITHINEVSGDATCHAHLLEFDSVQGRWRQDIRAENDAIMVDGRRIGFSMSTRPAEVDWAVRGVQLLVECSGQFKTEKTLQPYFEQGVSKVLVTAPVPEPALNLVYGINHHLYDPNRHHIVTAASCTTNCLAPVVKVMHENIGILRGSMTTIHDLTNTQTIVDKGHKDLRRARACGESLIPTTTGSAKAITKIFPELEGKLNGLAVRVPLLSGSLTDFVFEAAGPVTKGEVNGYLREAAEGPLKGILGYEARPLVSVDYRGDPRSAIVDALSTMVVDNTQVKVLAWYDNEWGYANRTVDVARMIAQSL